MKITRAELQRLQDEADQVVTPVEIASYVSPEAPLPFDVQTVLRVGNPRWLAREAQERGAKAILVERDLAGVQWPDGSRTVYRLAEVD